MENLFTVDCIRTFTGKYIDVFNPDPELICIEDIAHALSNICRFGGHLPQFYSVAQHSLLCSYKLPFEKRLAGLLHDASEAYLIDIPRPIKKRLPDYKRVEDNLSKVIAEKFGIPYPMDEEIKSVDMEILQFEWDNLMIKAQGHSEIVAITPGGSKYRFIEAFNLYNLKEPLHESLN